MQKTSRLTVAEALAWATAALRRSPELAQSSSRDAALLLRHTLALSSAELRARPERLLSAEDEQAFRAAIARRLAHEPIQYITGQQEFYGMTLQVSPAVLIPRPETELLVELTLAELRAGGERPLRILDIGTGSGAIALALAKHLPLAEVTALDLSPAALMVAQRNATQLGLAARMRFVRSDLMESLPPDEPLFDAIVSNPPYVAEAERDSLHPEVRDYEPSEALFAGAAGLDIYTRLIPAAWLHLHPGGLLALELGHGQQESLAGLLRGWGEVRFADDLQGIPRVAVARRPAENPER